MTTLYLQALSATSIASSLQISEPFLVIAGYTGRNAYAVNQHILELQAHGMTPPEMIPMFWTLPNWLLSVAQPVIQVHAGKKSRAGRRKDTKQACLLPFSPLNCISLHCGPKWSAVPAC